MPKWIVNVINIALVCFVFIVFFVITYTATGLDSIYFTGIPFYDFINYYYFYMFDNWDVVLIFLFMVLIPIFLFYAFIRFIIDRIRKKKRYTITVNLESLEVLKRDAKRVNTTARKRIERIVNFTARQEESLMYIRD